MKEEKQIEDDFMCMRLTNDNYIISIQGCTVKAKIPHLSHQRESYLKRLVRALRAAFRLDG